MLSKIRAAFIRCIDNFFNGTHYYVCFAIDNSVEDTLVMGYTGTQIHCYDYAMNRVTNYSVEHLSTADDVIYECLQVLREHMEQGSVLTTCTVMALLENRNVKLDYYTDVCIRREDLPVRWKVDADDSSDDNGDLFRIPRVPKKKTPVLPSKKDERAKAPRKQIARPWNATLLSTAL